MRHPRMIVAIVLLLVVTANAQLNPVPRVSPGQWSAWGLVDIGEMDLDFEALGGTEMDYTRWLAGVELGVIDGVSLFGGGGIMDMDISDYSDSPGTWIVGVRGAVALNDEWSLGGVGQVSGWSATDTVDVDAVETTLAAAVQWSSGPWSVYGGPYVHLLDGELSYLGIDLDVEGDDEFGGFLGAGYEIADSVTVSAEYRSIQQGAVVGVSWAF